VTRWLAGSFDPRAATHSARLAGALAPRAATIFASGPLQVAYSGPSAPGGPLCLLDGCLDNAPELSEALGAPAGQTAEQLLALGWRRWGRGLPSRLRGDFALLVWDDERGEGLLARDQLGVRSIFLHDFGGGLCFANEIRHLLALLPRRPAPDPVSVAHWLTMSNRPGSATLYAGVRRLNPGSVLALDRDGAREERYWEPRFTEPLAGSVRHVATQVRAALDRSLQRRIGPDGRAAVLMSGGLDSASVAAVAAAQAPGRVSAYSAVFPEHPAVDESVLIDQLRDALSLPGVTAQVRPGGLLASALAAIAAWELPLRSWGDFWALPLLRAAAGAGVQVTLGGDGGDELFGARAYLLADRLRAGHPLQAVALARDRPARRDVARIVGDTAVVGALPYRLHELLRRPLARRDAPPWLRLQAARELVDSDDPLAWKRLDGPRWWANIAHGLTRGIEETGVFEHQRQRATSAGLQARHPLFDLDLLELCLRQPPLATFDRHRDRPVLRAAMDGLLPDAVRLRSGKAWFNAVIVDCLTGPDGAATRRLLTDPGGELGAYVDRGGVQRALFDSDRHRHEQPFRWMWQVWRLATAECWLRSQADPGGQVLPEGLQASPGHVTLQPAPGSAGSEDPFALGPDDGASYVFPP
jgi:asparagine synthase (glutamine-hydrolysing)